MTSRPARDLSSAWRAFGNDLAVVDDHDPVGQVVGLFEVLGGEQHVGAVGDELAHSFPEGDAASRVEPGGRLVEQQDAGTSDEARAEVQAAAHPSGPPAHEPVGGLGEVEPFECRGGAAAGVGGGLAEEAGHDLEVLPSGHRFLDRGRLAGEPDQGAHTLRAAQGVDTRDAQRAGIGPGECRHRADEGRLAGAVRPEHGEHAAGRCGQRQPVQGGNLAVALDEAFGLDHGFHFEPPGV